MDLPPVHDRRQRAHPVVQHLLRVCRHVAQARLHVLGERADVEALAVREPDRAHAGEHRPVGVVRPVHGQEIGSAGEEVPHRHRVDLLERRRAHVHGRVDRRGVAGRTLVEARERRQREPVLHGVDGVIVVRPVCLRAPDDPHVPRRCLDQPGPLGHRAVPACVRHHEPARPRAARAAAGHREGVGPHVVQRQQVVAAAGVRHRHDHRLGGEIEPRDRVQGVEVRAHDGAELGRRERADVVKRVHRPESGRLAGRQVRHLPPGRVHHQERIQVDVGLDAEGVRLPGCA